MTKEMTNKIITIIAKQTDYSKETLDIEKDLEGELGIDSLTFLDISTEIAKEYGIPAEIFDIRKTNTIAKLIEFVRKNSKTNDKHCIIEVKVEVEKEANTQTEQNKDNKYLNIEEQIIAIISKQTSYSREALDINKDLEGELGIDSLTFLDISTEIAKKYDLPAEVFDVREYNTIEKLIKFVAQKKQINSSFIKKEKQLEESIQKEVIQEKAAQEKDKKIEETKRTTQIQVKESQSIDNESKESKKNPGNIDIENEIISIISQQTDYSREELDLNKDLEGELGIDSLTFLDISEEISKKYNISVSDLDIRECNTIYKLIQVVNNTNSKNNTAISSNCEEKTASNKVEVKKIQESYNYKKIDKETSNKQTYQIPQESNFQNIIENIDNIPINQLKQDKTFLSQGITNTQQKAIIQKIIDKYNIPTQIDLFSCDSPGKIQNFIQTALQHSILKVEDQSSNTQNYVSSDINDASLRDFIEDRKPDIFSKTQKFFNFYRQQQSKELLWFGMPSETRSGNRMVIYDEVSGRKKEFIMMASNNYLGLATHPKILEAIYKAYKKYGTTNTGSRIIGGTCVIHKQLEEKLADFKSAEACIVFPSGYSANLGTVSGLVRKNDAVFTDKVNHMSILDGCKLSGGKVKIYQHNDMKDLERILENCEDSIDGKLIVTDGVFSMHGDICNLPEIVRLANKYNARIMVDDAHSTGVLGKTGKGTTEHFNLKGHVDLEMGTLSKTFSAVGGFVAGREDVIEYLRFYANSYVFAATIPAGVAAGVMAAIDVIKEEPERRERLWQNINYMVSNLKNLGFDLGNTQSAIIPILIWDDSKALEMGKLIRAKGLYTQTVVFPGVAKGEARLRLSMMTEHTQKDMDMALEILSQSGKTLGLI